MENIIVRQDFFGDFRAETESNYKARISDVRKVWNFSKRDGFTSIEEVKGLEQKKYLKILSNK